MVATDRIEADQDRIRGDRKRWPDIIRRYEMTAQVIQSSADARKERYTELNSPMNWVETGESERQVGSNDNP